MDSALRPREIQSRIRAGQSLDEVARLSGESAERIERFAAPVLAEREHVAGLALSSSVRRRGELGGHRPLRAVVREQLLAHGVDPDTVAWDAWRNEDRRWTIQATWTQDEAERVARFRFDLGSRYSVADDAESRWLIAEDEDSLEHDELAIVHAVAGDSPPAGSAARTRHADPDEEPTISLADVPLRFANEPLKFAPEPRKSPDRRKSAEPLKAPQPAQHAESVEDEDWFPRSAATPQEIREEVEAEIDAYGVVPEGRSELDVLYDMLSGIAEDSINIYAGLNDPVVSEPAGDPGPEAIERGAEEPVPQTLDLESQPTELRVPGDASHTSDTGTRAPDGRASAAHSGASAIETRAARPDTRGPESAVPTETAAPSKTAAPTETPAPAHKPAPIKTPPPLHTPEQTRTGRQAAPPRSPAPAPQVSTPTGPKDSDQPAAPDTTGSAAPTDSPDGQPSLVDNEPTVQVAPGAAKRRGSRKKRASVPSWDEIMFGGPKLE